MALFKSLIKLLCPLSSRQDQTPRLTRPGPKPLSPQSLPPPRRSGFPARLRPLSGAGGGGVAFPGQAEGRVTLSWTLGQLADRQAPDAISGGAWLSAQFPFFHPLSETGEGKGVDVTSPQPQAAPGGDLGTRSGTAGRLTEETASVWRRGMANAPSRPCRRTPGHTLCGPVDRPFHLSLLLQDSS